MPWTPTGTAPVSHLNGFRLYIGCTRSKYSVIQLRLAFFSSHSVPYISSLTLTPNSWTHDLPHKISHAHVTFISIATLDPLCRPETISMQCSHPQDVTATPASFPNDTQAPPQRSVRPTVPDRDSCLSPNATIRICSVLWLHTTLRHLRLLRC